MDDCQLSLGRFWFTTLILFCCYFWFWSHVEVPNSLIQIIMVVATYLFASKGIKSGYTVATTYVNNRLFDKARNTPEMNKYKADAAKAAKDFEDL